ncbi:MAG: type II toxin-antitoxin system HicB family antitoxin [Peptococcaceae bacterium]|nr:type II toxin-antitoxin system HicB family antitoxin [Peptococcaceae bacterium]
MKNLDYYLNLKYETKLVGAGGAWAAAIPILPDCVAEGKSPQEAMAKLEEAKKLWLEKRLQSGQPIPEP